MIELYLKLIQKGFKTLEDVPKSLKSAVEERLKATSSQTDNISKKKT